MEILWTVDTNIAWGIFLSQDHLHRVGTCIQNSKEIALLPSVGAEIKSTLDNNVAKSMALGLTYEPPYNIKSGLLQKIATEIYTLRKHYSLLQEDAIQQFKEMIYKYVSVKTVRPLKHHFYEREVNDKVLQSYMEENSRKVSAAALAYKKYMEDIFGEVLEKIDSVLGGKKESRDKNILVDLVILSHKYPSLQICFLTNDKKFYRRWKKVYDSEEYQQFLKDNEIKYPIIFHYIPDLGEESVDKYEMYPSPSDESSLSLYQILRECM